MCASTLELVLSVLCCAVQALRDNTPDQWSSLPDLQQKRDDYYAELKAPHREILGESQV